MIDDRFPTFRLFATVLFYYVLIMFNDVQRDNGTREWLSLFSRVFRNNDFVFIWKLERIRLDEVLYIFDPFCFLKFRTVLLYYYDEYKSRSGTVT